MYWSAGDEPCSCGISCGRINSVCRITWSCWIVCGNTVVHVVLVLFVETPLYSKIDWSSLLGSSLSSSLEIILSTELLYLSGWLDVCWKHVDSTICSPYWRDANTASILTPCWIIGQQTIAERKVECIFYCWTAGSCLEWNKLMMYVCTLKNIYSSRYLDALLYKLELDWIALEECWFIYTRNKGMRYVRITLRCTIDTGDWIELQWVRICHLWELICELPFHCLARS